MKWIKKILAVCSFCSLLTVSNCFAMTLDNTIITEDKSNCYKTYLVQKDEQSSFIEQIEKEIEVDGQKYNFENYTYENKENIDTIDISTTKNIISETNNIENIINQLGNTINYNKDGYVGEYKLDTQNIQIKTIDNGFKEYLVEEHKSYTNLTKNDLDFIPKQIIKNNKTLDLLKVEWEVQTTKLIGESAVPNLYTAKCYYAGKERINYPDTYKVTAQYFGTATKKISNFYEYKVKYNKVEEKVPEITEEEKRENIVVPVVGGTSIFIFIVIFFFTKNVTVYNYKDGKYVRVGKTRININNAINITKYSLFETTNKYKLKFSKRLTSKMKNKMITIIKGKSKVKMLVNTDSENYTVEIRI